MRTLTEIQDTTRRRMHGLFIDRYCLSRGMNLSRSIVRASVTISFSKRSRRDAP